MNDIILHKRYIKNELKTSNSQRKNINNNILLRNSIAKKIKSYQQSNLLELGVVNKQRHSEKKYSQLSDRKNYLYKCSKPVIKMPNLDQPRILNNLDGENTSKVGSQYHRSQLFSKKQSNIKQRYLFKVNKANNLSFQSLNKINITQPLSKKNDLKKILLNQKPNLHNQSQNIINLNKSFSCKSRPITNLLNPQQLAEAFKNDQTKQLKNKINFKFRNDKNKRFYDQAITHLFEMARKNILIGKVQSEMPEQLGIKQIVIPKREEWAQRLKKCKKALFKKQENDNSNSNQCDCKQRLPLKLRTKTDAKLKYRNETQFDDNKQLWFDLVQKPFEPWQYENGGNTFFDY